MPQWPLTLPQQPVLNSTQFGSPVDAIVRTKMDSGPAKTRPRTTAAVRPLSMTFRPLTGAQVEIFENFHETDIKMGSLSFTFPHPRTDALVNVRFAGINEQYSINEIGRDRYALNVQLELLP